MSLGALDAMTHERMQELLLNVWGASKVGALLITHSVEEALFLGTRTLVLAPPPGFMIESADQFLVTDPMLVGLFLISALASAFDAVLRLVEHVFLP